jgi:Uri superfamily endonuclease
LDVRTDKGSYVLVLVLPEKRKISTGSLGAIDFKAGNYAYVGSALGGLESRLNRHLRSNKKLHWHIDYLLQEADICSIVICRTDERNECNIARALSGRFESVKNFGSSDCRCRSHLFYSCGGMAGEIMSALRELGLEPELREVAGVEIG